MLDYWFGVLFHWTPNIDNDVVVAVFFNVIVFVVYVFYSVYVVVFYVVYVVVYVVVVVVVNIVVIVLVVVTDTTYFKFIEVSDELEEILSVERKTFHVFCGDDVGRPHVLAQQSALPEITAGLQATHFLMVVVGVVMVVVVVKMVVAHKLA